MAALVNFDSAGLWQDTLVCDSKIGTALQALGLQWGRWPQRRSVVGESLDEALAAYQDEIDTLRGSLSIQSIDRVHVTPGQAGWPALRAQFVTEHTHADAEVRFFLGGTGLFYIRRPDGGYVALLCEAQEWIALPAGLPHFFDAGDEPDFDALRLFTVPNGWVAQSTGVARPELPLLDEFVAGLLERQGQQPAM
ncbi:MAG TPA: hypothetical protein VGC24_05950 [Burkholderiaceae bacterium]